MDYRPLGRTGVQVSKLCLGTMMFGAWGNTDHDDSIRIIHRALDAGINFVDTADVYSAGESEEIVGKALKGRRDDVVLATKFWGPMGDDPNRGGVSRRWIIAEVENSLRRLGTDWIDLYQMHRPDPETDIDETLGALSDLVHQGKVRYIGSSSFSAGQIVEAQWAARERRLERFRTEQPPYALLVRGIELDVLPTAQRHGMGILTYSPLAGGWLSGTWTADSSPTSPARQRLAARFDMSLPENQRKLEAVEQLAKVADDAGVSLIELAIAFVVNHPAVTSAIIGPRTMEQLESQLPAADVVIDTATLDHIDAIVRPGVNLNPADTSYGEQVLSPRCGAASPKEIRMQITRSSIDTQKGPADWFTGDVYIDAVAAPAGTSTFAAANVHFTPGARTAWHTHPHGQTIFVTEGVGLCQREGAPIEVIRPGDRVFFEPAEDHWHGAAPNRFMVHIAIQQTDETGSPVTWGEHVSDEQYAAGTADDT